MRYTPAKLDLEVRNRRQGGRIVWDWRVVGRNHKLIARTTQGYANRKDLLDSIALVYAAARAFLRREKRIAAILSQHKHENNPLATPFDRPASDGGHKHKLAGDHTQVGIADSGNERSVLSALRSAHRLVERKHVPHG